MNNLIKNKRYSQCPCVEPKQLSLEVNPLNLLDGCVNSINWIRGTCTNSGVLRSSIFPMRLKPY